MYYDGVQENGCRVMVSFKTRVHKHRVMAVKNRSNVGYTLEQVETVPSEVADLLKEVKKEEVKEKNENKEGNKKEGSILMISSIEWAINTRSDNCSILEGILDFIPFNSWMNCDDTLMHNQQSCVLL